MSRQRKFAVGAGMVKSPVHPAGEIERYILIGTPVIYSLPILILEEKRLSAQVHFEETLSGSCKAFIRPALERKGGTFLFARPFAEGQWAVRHSGEARNDRMLPGGFPVCRQDTE